MLAVVIGRRRQGKSTLALSLAKSQKKTIIVFDPNNQYTNVPIIGEVNAWMEDSGPASIGRILPADPAADWAALADQLDGGAWRWGDYTLILDECSMLMSPNKIEDHLERYARTSPKDVSVILTTHRSVDVHPLFRSLSTDWFLFHQFQDRDLEVIADNFGPDVARASAELPEYHAIHFWLATGGAPEWNVWDKPEAWYIDIGRID